MPSIYDRVKAKLAAIPITGVDDKEMEQMLFGKRKTRHQSEVWAALEILWRQQLLLRDKTIVQNEKGKKPYFHNVFYRYYPISQGYGEIFKFVEPEP